MSCLSIGPSEGANNEPMAAHNCRLGCNSSSPHSHYMQLQGSQNHTRITILRTSVLRNLVRESSLGSSEESARAARASLIGDNGQSLFRDLILKLIVHPTLETSRYTNQKIFKRAPSQTEGKINIKPPLKCFYFHRSIIMEFEFKHSKQIVLGILNRSSVTVSYKCHIGKLIKPNDELFVFDFR